MREIVAEIKDALTSPKEVCESLGLIGGPNSYKRGGSKYITICCPFHGEKNPSCSVRIAQNGHLAFKCHSCSVAGDVLHLVAYSIGANIKSDFIFVLKEAAKIAGLWEIVDELDSGTARPDRTSFAAPIRTSSASLEPERDYPPQDEVNELWASCGNLCTSEIAFDYMNSRHLQPYKLNRLDAVRVLSKVPELPSWCSYQGQTWRETGHIVLVPVFDHTGTMRSVRAWRVIDNDTPKRLPPAGFRASGLVIANDCAIAMLSGKVAPERVLIAEGEPNTLSWMVHSEDPALAIMGIISGSWNDLFSERFPLGIRVDVRMDGDPAGIGYTDQICESLQRRCFVYRKDD